MFYLQSTAIEIIRVVLKLALPLFDIITITEIRYSIASKQSQFPVLHKCSTKQCRFTWQYFEVLAILAIAVFIATAAIDNKLTCNYIQCYE